jgi:hypothetical protein
MNNSSKMALGKEKHQNYVSRNTKQVNKQPTI